MKKQKVPNARCRICGKEFYAKPSHLRRGWGRYCSRECRDNGLKTGKFVICAYCGKKVYKALSDLRRKSKTKHYFCSNSCHCAWKNKQRNSQRIPKPLKHLWRSWCNSSIRTCGVLGAGAHPVGLPTKIFFFPQKSKKRIKSPPVKRPSKKILYNLYWKENYAQAKIAEIFKVAHTSVKRWLRHYKIPVKPRSLSCGRNPNSLKSLGIGRTPEIERKAAEARRIYTKEKLIRKIKEFAKKNGRPPAKNEFAGNPQYPHFNTYQEYFGSWNKAIKTAGYEVNEPWFSPKSLPKDLRAQDGHPCNSISEIIIDDWLFKNEIPHKREYLYPEGKYRCDFVVGDIFIEFFGLANASSIHPGYSLIIEKKRKLCKKYKILFIELYEKNLYNLDQSLGRKLERVDTKALTGIF